MGSRDLLRQTFFAGQGWQRAEIHELKPDASFRRYFRLAQDGETVILMDAPPGRESLEDFVAMTRHLAGLDIAVPAIHHYDLHQGFALLQDLGDQTFTRLLAAGHDEMDLYRQALDVLIALQTQPKAVEIDVASYGQSVLLAESGLFVNWYLPAMLGNPLAHEIANAFDKAISACHQALPILPPALVLRDYHIDNLMLVNERCVVLDYQDALIGSPAYDVMSLLQDARRDVDPDMATALLDRYLAAQAGLDAGDFYQHYAFWAVQRHLKVAGIFVRLWLRDDKDIYLGHLDRVMAMLDHNLHHPSLEALAVWFDLYNMPRRHRPIELDAKSLRHQVLPPGLE